MREIKFRGKRIEYSEWVCGYLIGDNVIAGNVIKRKDGRFDVSFHYEVDPETVGQYTGLKDSNGKEIYEGDALFVQGGNEHQGYREFSETGYVEFASGSFMLAYHSHGNKVYADFGQFNQEDTEIISNIYEHPHLLKEANTHVQDT